MRKAIAKKVLEYGVKAGGLGAAGVTAYAVGKGARQMSNERADKAAAKEASKSTKVDPQRRRGGKPMKGTK